VIHWSYKYGRRSSCLLRSWDNKERATPRKVFFRSSWYLQ
jgi:hypothetical protein